MSKILDVSLIFTTLVNLAGCNPIDPKNFEASTTAAIDNIDQPELANILKHPSPKQKMMLQSARRIADRYGQCTGVFPSVTPIFVSRENTYLDKYVILAYKGPVTVKIFVTNDAENAIVRTRNMYGASEGDLDCAQYATGSGTIERSSYRP